MNNDSTIKERSVGVGLVGTGYVASLRAEALHLDERTQLVAVVGNTQEKAAAFAFNHQTEAMTSWQKLVEREDVDLVAISTVNRDHGAIARLALQAGKHVIVEYPLSLDVKEAQELITLSKSQNKLLHVEHIELLGGLHQALKQHLPQIGQVFYARYSTINPQNPAPRKWTYDRELFGFPLSGALSRLHRLVDLFGNVTSVNCHNRFWQTDTEYYQGCFLSTQLCFTNGLLAEVVYGKGETLWDAERKFEVHGENGGLIFDGDKGVLVHAQGRTPIEVGTRKGLFAKDTNMAIDHLINGTPLYVTPEQSLYSLLVADAARRSAETGVTVIVSNPDS